MPDQPSIDATAPDAASTRKDQARVVGFGHKVAGAKPGILDEDLLESFEAAAISEAREACRIVVQDALNLGFSAEEIVDHYIPEVSRRIGELWCADNLGFANVTIAVSRLQSLLRELGLDWSGDVAGDPNAPMVLLVVPHEVYHTLGAMILGSQLRRLGISVRISLGLRNEELATRLQRSNFQGVFISASCSETLETLSRIVDVVKNSTVTPPPIVIGGSLLDVETKENVTALTGADYATRIPSEALELCGLSKTLHGEPQRTRGS
ncbi:cobalamin B12-binding domain-containing protein [Cognatiyoonia sp. IB215446]|uniref:cobalamin B12-binding domain-containing protein n=1 Tax=Cognatiyoonia sp. IB215446 TaxID=3097355 RepID=UPI002A175604|nr:cobalamin B12-binding domain-containing protein [Cognatiyoonia sp. IB215446]MDX8349132.1 cobalamin B12-binding domain-containing protein [Cognatiyoonia sp. IB215446]